FRSSLPPAPPAAPGRSQGSAPATPAAFRNGQRAASYLPSAVQHGMITQVPRPGLWTGEIYQVSRDNEPVEQEVGVLRMDENAAVVVHAMRTRPRSGVSHAHAAQHLAQTPWTITQVTYDLRQRQTLEGGTRTAI